MARMSEVTIAVAARKYEENLRSAVDLLTESHPLAAKALDDHLRMLTAKQKARAYLWEDIR